MPALYPPSAVRLFASLARRYIVPGAAKDAGLRLVFDLESDGLLADATKVHCVGGTGLDDDSVDEFGPEQIPAALEYLTQAAAVIGHNALTFDVPLLAQLHGWRPKIVRDTLVASRLILPNLADLDNEVAARTGASLGKLHGKYSLAAWGIRLGIPKVGTDIDVWAAWTPEIQERCAVDVTICKALWHFLQVDGYSQQAIELEHHVAVVCDQITRDGAPFDVAAAEYLQREWEARRDELERQLQQQLPELDNPNSRKQIGALLESRGWKPSKRTEKTSAPVIDDEVLESLPALYPEFAGLFEYDLLRRRIAQLATGPKALLKCVSDDGRIHGGLVHIGTPHSRAKHFSPNLGQVPNPKKGARYAAEFRALFRHPGDWIFVACDQKNLQDRCFAHYLAEFDGGAYAEAFRTGIDPHWRNACAFGLISEGTAYDKANLVHIALREAAKRLLYAILFGAGPKRISEILSETVRAVRFLDANYTTSTSGADVLDRFVRATPGLAQLRATLSAQHLRNGWVLGLDGRRVPTGADYKSLNRLVTSAEAITCKRWLANVYDELSKKFRYGWDGDVIIALWVHDEITCCCRPEIDEQVGEIMVRHAKEVRRALSAQACLSRPNTKSDAAGLVSHRRCGHAIDYAKVRCSQLAGWWRCARRQFLVMSAILTVAPNTKLALELAALASPARLLN